MPLLVMCGLLGKKITSASLFFSCVYHVYILGLASPTSLKVLSSHLFTLPYRRQLEVYQRSSVLMSIVLMLVLSCFKSLQFLDNLVLNLASVCLENIFYFILLIYIVFVP